MENVEKKKSGLATAGLVLGIIGICLSFIPIINNASFFLGILAVIFGIIPLVKKASKKKSDCSSNFRYLIHRNYFVFIK